MVTKQRPVSSYKFGLKPPDPRKPVKLKMKRYANFAALPSVPTGPFGHMNLVTTPWGMLGNDDWGDCASAGPCHQEMMFCAEGERPVSFSTATALSNYTQIGNLSEPGSGFNIDAGPPGKNPTDNGLDLDDMAKYWRQTGFVDDHNQRHQIYAYVELEPGNVEQLWLAMYLFQSVGIGWDLPNSAMEQTQAGQVWDVVANDGGSAGGHYTPGFNRDSNENGVAVSWGEPQPFTTAFFQKYNNQGIAVLSKEIFKSLASADIDGFGFNLLDADLTAMTA
jgi:hypothetical protein